MYSLFIDTHSNLIRICLYQDDNILEIKEQESVMHHSDYLMNMIDEIIKNNKLSIRDISEILVINGPGSFTGVRLGVTVAKMLAFTLNIKIKTMTSLDMFAISSNKDKVIATVEDIKGYYGAYYENKEKQDDYFYKSKQEFFDYIKGKEDLLINNEVNYEMIKEVFNNKKDTNPHVVNPIYIKLIEALK